MQLRCFWSLLVLLVLSTAATANSSDLHLCKSANVSQSFRLKTSGATSSAHNSLYVNAYHTGAGLNDATLTPDAAAASTAVINSTYTQFDLGGGFPWYFAMGSDTNYAEWEPVQINAAGGGSQGFFINSTGLQWSSEMGFGGWLVCEWVHGGPQLFWLYRWYSPTIPCSCSEVSLTVEHVD